MAMNDLSEAEFISRLHDWAAANNNVRAAILVGSRTDPEANIDAFSDYDINLYVKSLEPLWLNDDWLSEFGSILVRCPWQPGSFREGWLTRMAVFKEGFRIDFQITADTPEIHDHINGFQIIIDKENLAANFPEPTFEDFFVKKPSAEEFGKFVHEFWWDAIYVAKSLWRDELFYAKHMLDNSLRFDYQQKLIEWSIAVDHHWSVRPNKFGRKFKLLLSRQEWQRIEATFAGASIEENWQAFFNALSLFNELAQKVATDLGFDYPETLARETTEHLKSIHKLPKDKAS
ncbi:MAG: aminoglycoside 6-adenylyltransferase [Pseudomonadota bacterium]